MPHSTLERSSNLREFPSEKVNVREDLHGLGRPILCHGQSLQLGQKTTVMLGPQKALAKMLNFRSSFRDVKHLFATSSVYVPERAEIESRASPWGLPVPPTPLEILASCGSGQGPGKQPGLRASTVNLAECALDAKRQMFS